MYEKIERWYKQGLWTTAMVEAAGRKGVITQEQVEEIIGPENGEV